MFSRFRTLLLIVLLLMILTVLSSCIPLLKRIQVTITSTPLLGELTVGKRERTLPYTFMVRKGEKIQVKAPLVPGYDFVGWLINNELDEAANIEVSVEDATLIKAVYAPKLVDERTIGGKGNEFGAGISLLDSSSLAVGITTDSTNSALILNNLGGEDFWTSSISYDTGKFVVAPQKSYGGSSDEWLSSIARITGGTISAGWTISEDIDFSGSGYPYRGGVDGYVFMLQDDGKLAWQTYIGGSGDDYIHSVSITVGERILLVGSTTSNDGNMKEIGYRAKKDGWISLMSSYGTVITGFMKAFGGTDDDELLHGMQTRDGGYILCGYSKSTDGDLANVNRSLGEDLWVIRLNHKLEIVWQRLMGGQKDERAHVVKEVDGGFIVAGYTTSTGRDITENKGGKDVWVLKFNYDGTLQWSRTLGGSKDEEAFDIIQTADGGYALCGYTESADGDIRVNKGKRDLWVVKLGSDGFLEWEATFGGTDIDEGTRIVETAKRELLVIGTTYSNDRDVLSGLNGKSDAWLLRLGK